MDISMIATIAVIVFLAIFVISGFYRGFLRIILSTFSLIITIILVGALVGPVSDYVENKTVIGSRVQGSIESYIDTQLASVPETATHAQEAFINALPLPESMKTDLISQNTLGNYADQGVSTFSEFLSVNLTSIVIKILCYVILFLLIFLILKFIMRISNLINHIPILGGVNRIIGGVFGFIEGVIFLWLLCLVIMMLSGSDFGASCEKVIASSPFLSYIYEHNYLMNIANWVAGLFKK